MNIPESFLAVDRVAVQYKSSGFRRAVRNVLHDVTFSMARGETLALVGESGSGKSTLGKALLGLVPVSSGTISFQGRDITHLDPRRRRAMASEIQVVFQNPYGSLNPALTVGQILAEPLFATKQMSREAARRRVRDLLDSVHLPADAESRYPSNFSGGQRQRVAIARALALEPSLVVCDEPTSALDVTTQASVLDLLAEIQERTGTSYLFITHDLAVVRHFASRVLVLEDGRIVEDGTTAQVCEEPSHPYTKSLVAAAPVPDPIRQRERRARRMGLDLAKRPAQEPERSTATR